MFTFPSSRRLLLPAILLLATVFVYKSLVAKSQPLSRASIARILLAQIPQATPVQDQDIAKYSLPIRNPSQAHLSPPQHFYYNHNFSRQNAPHLTHIAPLLTCSITPNPHTNHIRLPNLIFNVSSTPPDAQVNPHQKFNPTIIALPHWSPNHYLLVTRVVTEGLHQESLLCEANICLPSNATSRSLDSSECLTSDHLLLGPSGGLRCATPPVIINIPPTPAEHCTGAWTAFPDIPGFHDPRIFWSGKGEPLIIVNSASRYGCVGLWIVDLRTLYRALVQMLAGQDRTENGPLMSYPHLTELTRNPRGDRSAVEKNWMLFFPNREEAFVHYDMVSNSANTSTSGRSFAKLIGNGYTTPNLADPAEKACFDHEGLDGRGQRGHWHQGSNALKLILCTREAAKRGNCHEDEEGRAVHFAVMHRKFSNDWKLPLRYERWFVVWEGKAPCRLLGKSRFPVLFYNETASGWTGAENWATSESNYEQREVLPRRWHNGTARSSNATQWLNASNDSTSYLPNKYANQHDPSSPENDRGPSRKNWAYFTYTPSIAWAWRPKSAEIKREDRDGGSEDGSYLHSLNVGYLDDEVIIGIGLEDTAQAFAKAKASTLLQCLELCPGAESTVAKEKEREKEQEEGQKEATRKV